MPLLLLEQPGSHQKKEASFPAGLSVQSLGANHEEFYWDQDLDQKVEQALDLIQDLICGVLV